MTAGPCIATAGPCIATAGPGGVTSCTLIERMGRWIKRPSAHTEKTSQLERLASDRPGLPAVLCMHARLYHISCLRPVHCCHPWADTMQCCCLVFPQTCTSGHNSQPADVRLFSCSQQVPDYKAGESVYKTRWMPPAKPVGAWGSA